MSSEARLRASQSGKRRWWLLIAIVVVATLPLLFQDSYWRANLISRTQVPIGTYAIKTQPDIAVPRLAVLSRRNSANMVYLVADLAFLYYVLLDQHVRSPIGQALAAIREDEVSAASCGINCTV